MGKSPPAKASPSPVWKLKEWPKIEKIAEKTVEKTGVCVDVPKIQDIYSETKNDDPCDVLLREDETEDDGASDKSPQEVDAEILYGDLEELVDDETDNKKEESSKYLNPMFSPIINENIDNDLNIKTIELDDSFESQDSNQLVIDLDIKEDSDVFDGVEASNSEFLMKQIMDTVVGTVVM